MNPPNDLVGHTVGYASHSVDYSHPADRRKFHYYLKHRAVQFEQASLNQHYDLTYITSSADIISWARKMEESRRASMGGKFIFELCDAYLHSGGFEVKSALRGLYRYVSGKSASLGLSYKKSLAKIIRLSDAVVCGSVEQKQMLEGLNDNVWEITDSFRDDLRSTKTSYEIDYRQVNVVWEGLASGNYKNFVMLRDVLSGANGVKVNLHIISDKEYCLAGARHACRATTDILDRIFAGTNVSVYFYSWHRSTFSAIAASCDFALIPIPNDSLMKWKPENKLILLWLLGLPVICSGIPAYQRVMKNAGLDWVCESTSQWEEKLALLTGSQRRREEYIKTARQYAQNNYGEIAVLNRWDHLLESVLFGSGTLDVQRQS